MNLKLCMTILKLSFCAWLLSCVFCMSLLVCKALSNVLHIVCFNGVCTSTVCVVCVHDCVCMCMTMCILVRT